LRNKIDFVGLGVNQGCFKLFYLINFELLEVSLDVKCPLVFIFFFQNLFLLLTKLNFLKLLL